MMKFVRLKTHRLMILTLIVCLLCLDLSVGLSVNDEGFSLLRFRDRVANDPFGALSNWKDDFGVPNHCSWFGVECSNGHVVALNLINMRLGGTLASELGNLAHIKSIILRNNSFYGMIPKKIRKLKKLKLLDLRYNNFGDHDKLSFDFEDSQPPKIILLDNNNNKKKNLDGISPEVQQLTLLPKAQQRLRNIAQTGIKSHRKLLQLFPGENINVPVPSQLTPSPSPSPSPTPSPSPSPSPTPSPSPAPSAIPNQPSAPTPPRTTGSTPSLPPPPSATSSGSSNNHIPLILGVVIGVFALVALAALVLWRCNKVATVRPWATGLSGQLQKAFVTGVPKLKRSELEAACEDFSNVIGSTTFGTVYKGTLSSGVEIAVASVATPSTKDWSKQLESQFRKRIDMLSKVNHKNFVNLLGFCEEDEPFTRMIAFEYAPNGTLYEHLHVQESEHLDWGMRMRITMGMAYCLDHMHNLTPPISHKNLNSPSVNLTEDYAAKISDFGLCNDSYTTTTEQPTPENNVYSFGVILFEIRRPKMREVCSRLKEITRIAQDGATPKISPLWWAELEILSTEAT
ncbi:putative protein kinase RLK-Pelle-LRR-VI-2 family [Helianthus annuus]|nr:putative protein kinase RLK-Pelle-LRR-VI-2 family [Helianthus annuus]